MKKIQKPTKVDLICEELYSKIASKELRVGDRTPSVRELMNRYSCAKMTVINAFKRLKTEKVIYVENGSGAYVCPKTRTKLILILSPKNPGAFFEFENIAYYLFVSGCKKACDEKYLEHTVSYETYDAFLKNADIMDVIYPNLSGVILFRGYEYIQIINDKLHSKGIPALSYGSKIDDAMISNHSIYIDEEKVAGKAVDYLLKMGHKSVGILYYGNHNVHIKLLKEVESAFRKAGVTLGDQNKIPVNDPYGKDVEKCLTPLRGYRSIAKFSALFSLSDALALEALWTLTQWGIRCPDDISLMSSENTPYIHTAKPGITCISRNIETDGEQAISMLIDKIIHSKKIINIESSISLLERQSVQAI